MASQATKMFAVFALLALCASAATAVLVPPYLSPITAMGALADPCMQYCMMAFTSPSAMTMLQQRCGMQTIMPSMMMTRQQCNCAAIWQMMQRQPYMRTMAMQFPFMLGAMTPFAFLQQPFFGGAFFQQPFFLGSGF